MSREGLRSLITAQSDLTVCGEHHSCQESRLDIAATRPDLVVFEPFCRAGFSTDLIIHLSTLRPRPLACAVSIGEESLYAERALRAGANGYLSKACSSAEILTGIRQVLHGETYVSKSPAADIIEPQTSRAAKTTPSTVPVELFSDRELSIFRLIGQGKTTIQIAKFLHLTVSTVGTYRHRLREKLGLKTGLEVTHCAIGWVEDEGRQSYQI